MKKVYLVTYEISDKGTTYPETQEEVIVDQGSTPRRALEKLLNKYRHASNLSRSYQVRISNTEFAGSC